MKETQTLETAVTTRAISISDDDIAALLAIRSVIADSAHPGRAAAMAALAKLVRAKPPAHIPVDPPSAATIAEIVALYGFDSLEIERRATHRDYVIFAAYRGDTLWTTTAADISSECPLSMNYLWASVIHCLAKNLNIPDVATKNERLAKILGTDTPYPDSYLS